LVINPEISQEMATRARCCCGPDAELDPDCAPSDLHSLRSINTALDLRAARIQEKSADQAAEEILKNDPMAGRIKTLKILVTGGGGYLGSTLAAALRRLGAQVITMDVVNFSEDKTRQNVDVVGSVENRELVVMASAGCDVIFNTAALHAPHATKRHRDEFESVNIGGIESILSTDVPVIIQTSTTSLTITNRVKERESQGECVWLDETSNAPLISFQENINSLDENDEPRNKYGRTKKAAEKLCMDYAKKFLVVHENDESQHPVVDQSKEEESSIEKITKNSREMKKSIVILRTSRFFCEDLLEESSLSLANSMANELLGRRAALVDVVTGHIKAMLRAETLSSRIYVLSCPWPFKKEQTIGLSSVEVARMVQNHYGENVYQKQTSDLAAAAGSGSSPCACAFVLPDRITRIYDSSATCNDLEWKPLWTFETVIEKLSRGDEDALLGLY
jgi:UDP-glucose 4-epimerase